MLETNTASSRLWCHCENGVCARRTIPRNPNDSTERRRESWSRASNAVRSGPGARQSAGVSSLDLFASADSLKRLEYEMRMQEVGNQFSSPSLSAQRLSCAPAIHLLVSSAITLIPLTRTCQRVCVSEIPVLLLSKQSLARKAYHQRKDLNYDWKTESVMSAWL